MEANLALAVVNSADGTKSGKTPRSGNVLACGIRPREGAGKAEEEEAAKFKEEE